MKMKSILKLLVLGAVPILAVTMAADPALAADKGSQLIFQNNMGHTSYISIANANDKEAVTVLTQYYNDKMEMVVWYLRILQADANVLINPFDHTIPGTKTNIGDAITATGKAGSGHFVIAVTAVAGDAKVDDTADGTDNPTDNPRSTANLLFPDFLVGKGKAGLHGTDNIDNCGAFKFRPDPIDSDITRLDDNLAYTKFGTDGKDDCKTGTGADTTSKNVGKLAVTNAIPIAFNHLTGHFTEALVSTADGGSDQTASWGGTPIVRPAVSTTANGAMYRDTTDGTTTTLPDSDYQKLTGADETPGNEGGGRLAEKDAGGAEQAISHTVSGYANRGGNMTGTTGADNTTNGGKIRNGARAQRGLNNGALVLPALHGGGAESKQIMLLLSVADEFDGAGKYKLIPAMTKYMVSLMDVMGDALADPAAADAPVFGGTKKADDPKGTMIIVNGIQVMTDAGKCGGDAHMGPWMLTSLTDIVPAATAGGKKDFAGLDATIDPMVNASPGWIKFKRMGLECEKDFGDGDAAFGSTIEDADGVPTTDKRTYKAGTLVMDEAGEDRSFVTTGRALLKFINPMSTFAASWTLKSPPSPAN